MPYILAMENHLLRVNDAGELTEPEVVTFDRAWAKGASAGEGFRFSEICHNEHASDVRIRVKSTRLGLYFSAPYAVVDGEVVCGGGKVTVYLRVGKAMFPFDDDGQLVMPPVRIAGARIAEGLCLATIPFADLARKLPRKWCKTVRVSKAEQAWFESPPTRLKQRICLVLTDGYTTVTKNTIHELFETKALL